ncbi:hypothetical protein EP331_10835 [bacterium]|nr:MAG: hypothetical protein EP331_10835 [bacterium]
MKIFITKSLLAGVLLLALNFIGLYATVYLFPSVAEQYYSPTFDMDGYKGYLFMLHPFVLSFALAWFWQRSKQLFKGSFIVRGLELGLVYGLVAVLPSMWMILSAFDVTVAVVVTWLIHGIIQGSLVGMIYAKINP